MKTTQLINGDETYRILGACFEVYKVMGCGFLEAVYQECLDLEFGTRGIRARGQVPMQIQFKGKSLNQRYIADFICFEKIIVELKTVTKIADENRAQLLNYMRASSLKVGLLVNFSHRPGLEYERFVL